MGQQQVDRAIERGLRGAPPSGKCKVFVKGHFLSFWHYQHLLLIYDMRARGATYTWFEKPTDKNILSAALETLGRLEPPLTHGASSSSESSIGAD